jgi:hypothetical protein
MATRSFGFIAYLWKGESASPPANPAQNWVYRNTADGNVYLFDAGVWNVMLRPGSPGPAGADGISPVVAVKENTETSYILTISYNDVAGQIQTFDTPNLKGGSVGGIDQTARDAAQLAQQTVDTHIGDTANPHSITKAQIGLGDADNTADADKPVSSAQQTAITSGVSDAKSYADSLFANVNTAEFAGPFNAVANIPTPYDTNDLYLVGTAEPYDIYAYVQGQLKKIGSSAVDLSGYYNKADVDAYLANKANNADLTVHTGNGDIHITSAQKTAWTNKLDKPGNATQGHFAAFNASRELTDSAKTSDDFATAAQGLAADNHRTNNDIHVTAAQKTAWSGKQDANIALTDAAASTTLPATASDTIVSKIQAIFCNLKALFSYFTNGILKVVNGGTGLSSIPQYSVLAASGNNALIAYRRGGLGVLSHASISNEYKNFTNLIARTSMSFLQDVADAQVEFTGFMKTITANQYDDALGILKIRWSELVYTGGSVDLTSSGIVINATDLIKSFFPAITANSIGYNNITLMPGAVGTCGRVTAYNQQGVKGNPIFGGGVLFYDSADGLKVSGVITSDNSAILVWEMEFPVAVSWNAAECAVFAEI